MYVPRASCEEARGMVVRSHQARGCVQNDCEREGVADEVEAKRLGECRLRQMAPAPISRLRLITDQIEDRVGGQAALRGAPFRWTGCRPPWS